MKGLLNECLPQAQYSAISSNVTLSDDIFKNIKQGMEDEGLWNEELEQKLFFCISNTAFIFVIYKGDIKFPFL